MCYKKFLINSQQYYFKYSLNLSERSKKYLSRIRVVDKKLNIKYPVKYDFLKKYRNDYLWYLFVSDYLQKQAKNDNKVAIFLTVTLPSEYHPFKTLKNGKHIKNKSYDDKIIFEGYKKLQKSFRYLYSSFKVNRKSVRFKFIRVVEPHSDFTPHLHSIVFIDKEHIQQFERHFLNTIKLFSLGKQYKFEIIKNIDASISYLLKYVRKNLYSNDERDARIFDGWKRANKIRVFLHSQISVSRELYNIVSRYCNLDIKNLYSDIIDYKELWQSGTFTNYNILELLKHFVSYSINFYDDKNQLYNQKKHSAKNTRYHIEINKKRLKNRKFKEYETLLSLIDFFKKKENRIDYDLIFSELDKFCIDLKELHNFYCIDYCNYMIDYISDDYDYRKFFIFMDRFDFLNLLEDFIYNECVIFDYRYKIIDIKILEANKYNPNRFDLIFNKQDYEVQYYF